MKIVGRGFLDAIRQKTKVKSGTIMAIKVDPQLNKRVLEVLLDTGETILLPYRTDAQIGGRVVIEGDNFFLSK